MHPTRPVVNILSLVLHNLNSCIHEEFDITDAHPFTMISMTLLIQLLDETDTLFAIEI